MNLRLPLASLPFVVLASFAACKSGGVPEVESSTERGGRGGSASSAGSAGTSATAGAAGTSGPVAGGAAGSGGGVDVSCGFPDCDKDGYAAPADCNDADPTVNPDAYDFLGDGLDNDCSGQVDNPVETCEPSPDPAALPGTPAEFARAMDICPQRSIGKNGAVVDPLIQFAWGKITGPGLDQQNWESRTKPALQANIVSSFGKSIPQKGLNMAGLATGPWGDKNPRNTDPLDPPGYSLRDACLAIPLAPADCAILSNGSVKGTVGVQDFAELDLWLQIPSNVKGVTFDFSFFTTEFNQYWNAATNDAFFVLASNSTMTGLNVAKQADGTGISVNSGFFQLCPKTPPPGLTADKLPALGKCVGNEGDAATQVLGSLLGTYYDGSATTPFDQTVLSTDGTKKYLYGGGTGWLKAAFPVTPGEQIMLRFMIMDTFDGLKDSSVLLDHLAWVPVPPTPGIERPPVK